MDSPGPSINPVTPEAQSPLLESEAQAEGQRPSHLQISRAIFDDLEPFCNRQCIHHYFGYIIDKTNK